MLWTPGCMLHEWAANYHSCRSRDVRFRSILMLVLCQSWEDSSGDVQRYALMRLKTWPAWALSDIFSYSNKIVDPLLKSTLDSVSIQQPPLRGLTVANYCKLFHRHFHHAPAHQKNYLVLKWEGKWNRFFMARFRKTDLWSHLFDSHQDQIHQALAGLRGKMLRIGLLTLTWLNSIPVESEGSKILWFTCDYFWVDS